jgi:predicted AAA+ superfamily ATPase
MTLAEQGYRSRLMDVRIGEMLESFGAVSIEGPKYCGKTWTALSHANSAVYVMDPEGGFANRRLAQVNPGRLLEGDGPRLIDEWQVAPGLWDAVRFAVDKGRGKGRFILTGSTTPVRDSPLHSGAGRIARVYLRPMTLFESGESDGSVSISGLFAGASIEANSAKADLEEIARICVRGGWPENVGSVGSKVSRMPTQYLEAVQTSDISGPDGVARDSDKVAALLRALARNNATMASNNAIKWDLSQGERPISSPTVASYLTALKQIFVLEEIPAWAPDIRAKLRSRLSPKRYLVDPSLVAAALGMAPAKLLADMPTFGSVFEGLCVRDLQVYAWMMDAKLCHYHDEDGLEVDVIIERRDGEYAAVEVKLTQGNEDVAARTLLRFDKKMRAKGVLPPKLSIIVTGGGLSYRREDGIVVAPVTCLRD